MFVSLLSLNYSNVLSLVKRNHNMLIEVIYNKSDTLLLF